MRRVPGPHLDTVKARLLGLFLLIAVPIGAITTVTAIVNYRSSVKAIEATQTQTASDFALRMRLWYVGVLRSLIISAATIDAEAGDDSCRKAGAASLDNLDGYRAVFVRRRDGTRCFISNDPGIRQNDVEALVATQRGKQLELPKVVRTSIESRYDATMLAGSRRLLVYGREHAAQGWEILLVVDSKALSRVFNAGRSSGDFAAALSTDENVIIFTRGNPTDDTSWLPPAGAFPLPANRWSAFSAAGDNRIYYATSVGDPNLYVIASFLTKEFQAARTQFILLLFAPLIAIALLLAVLTHLMNTHLVQWLKSIGAASRLQGPSGSAQVSLTPHMPSDIRQVIEAFNTMVEEQAARETRWQEAVATNLALTRELHHRVKNNLQVMQSYIGLAKKDYSGEARQALSEAECRVHVLSAAYRGALAEGEMRPVEVESFLKDVAATAARLLCWPGQFLTIEGRASVILPVDRIVPLGLLVVDRVSGILHDTKPIRLRIMIADREDGHFAFSLAADRHAEKPIRSRIQQGLITQLEARNDPAADKSALGAWILIGG